MSWRVKKGHHGLVLEEDLFKQGKTLIGATAMKRNNGHTMVTIREWEVEDVDRSDGSGYRTMTCNLFGGWTAAVGSELIKPLTERRLVEFYRKRRDQAFELAAERVGEINFELSTDRYEEDKS